MSAQIVHLAVAVPAERRRAITLRDVSVSLQAVELTVRATVPTLGNRDAYLALRAAYEKLDVEMGRIECLADEFLDLAQDDEAENAE